MNISAINKKEYVSPCVDVVEIHMQSVILEGSPLEDIGEGGEHPWD